MVNNFLFCNFLKLSFSIDYYIKAERSIENNENLKELKQSFDLIANDDGAISLNDLRNVMRSVGQNPTEYELNLMIQEADANNDNLIDFPEFVAVFIRFLGKRKELPDMKNFEDIFEKDDKGDNYLNAQKLHEEMNQLGVNIEVAVLDRLIQEADKDGDGKIGEDGSLIFKFKILLVLKFFFFLNFRIQSNDCHGLFKI